MPQSRRVPASFLSSSLAPLLCLCFLVFYTFIHTLCDENASVEKPRSNHPPINDLPSLTGICWKGIFITFTASTIRGSPFLWYFHPSFFAIAVAKHFLYHTGLETITFDAIRRDAPDVSSKLTDRLQSHLSLFLSRDRMLLSVDGCSM